ncbi:uncharacterized protein LOC143225313 isoform X2 [Tachypleus tridentatus]|uniref:uncharacterized protein LOC143225313 isoform X2 n=1 Tax=Tachypleus tridentatus TaxID=6853 RepID=UPI003FD66927
MANNIPYVRMVTFVSSLLLVLSGVSLIVLSSRMRLSIAPHLINMYGETLKDLGRTLSAVMATGLILVITGVLGICSWCFTVRWILFSFLCWLYMVMIMQFILSVAVLVLKEKVQIEYKMSEYCEECTQLVENVLERYIPPCITIMLLLLVFEGILIYYSMKALWKLRKIPTRNLPSFQDSRIYFVNERMVSETRAEEPTFPSPSVLDKNKDFEPTSEAPKKDQLDTTQTTLISDPRQSFSSNQDLQHEMGKSNHGYVSKLEETTLGQRPSRSSVVKNCSRGMVDLTNNSEETSRDTLPVHGDPTSEHLKQYLSEETESDNKNVTSVNKHSYGYKTDEQECSFSEPLDYDFQQLIIETSVSETTEQKSTPDPQSCRFSVSSQQPNTGELSRTTAYEALRRYESDPVQIAKKTSISQERAQRLCEAVCLSDKDISYSSSQVVSTKKACREDDSVFVDSVCPVGNTSSNQKISNQFALLSSTKIGNESISYHSSDDLSPERKISSNLPAVDDNQTNCKCPNDAMEKPMLPLSVTDDIIEEKGSVSSPVTSNFTEQANLLSLGNYSPNETNFILPSEGNILLHRVTDFRHWSKLWFTKYPCRNRKIRFQAPRVHIRYKSLSQTSPVQTKTSKELSVRKPNHAVEAIYTNNEGLVTLGHDLFEHALSHTSHLHFRSCIFRSFSKRIPLQPSSD